MFGLVYVITRIPFCDGLWVTEWEDVLWNMHTMSICNPMITI